jgi:hypothetical protein
VHGAGEVSLLELVLLANVDDDGAVAPVLRQLVDVARIDLRDPLLRLLDEIRSTWHFIKDSNGSRD